MTPLTALKFAELSVKAGIPKGVINILPGSGIMNVHQYIVHTVSYFAMCQGFQKRLYDSPHAEIKQKLL